MSYDRSQFGDSRAREIASKYTAEERGISMSMFVGLKKQKRIAFEQASMGGPGGHGAVFGATLPSEKLADRVVSLCEEIYGVLHTEDGSTTRFLRNGPCVMIHWIPPGVDPSNVKSPMSFPNGPNSVGGFVFDSQSGEYVRPEDVVPSKVDGDVADQLSKAIVDVIKRKQQDGPKTMCADADCERCEDIRRNRELAYVAAQRMLRRARKLAQRCRSVERFTKDWYESRAYLKKVRAEWRDQMSAARTGWNDSAVDAKQWREHMRKPDLWMHELASQIPGMPPKPDD